jgi:hypothetical protein
MPSPPGSGTPDTRAAAQSLLLDAGWADWGLGGNQSKFRQYATPPSGWFLRDLRLAPIFTPHQEDMFVSLKGLGEDDYRGDGRLALNSGQTIFRGSLSQDRFFDPTTAVTEPSAWRTYGLYGKQALTRAFSLSFNYRDDEERLHFAPPSTSFGPPTPFLDQRLHYWDLRGGGKLGGQGFGSLSLVDWSYLDHSGTFPSIHAQAAALTYLWTPVDTVGIEAGLSRTWIREQNSPSSKVDTASLSGNVALGLNTDLDLAYERRHLDLPVVQNAWERDQQQGSFLLTHHFGGWNAQLGLRIRQDQRIRGDQSYVDVPYWTTVNGRLTGKINRHLRLNVRASAENLSNPPPMITSDPSSLFWSSQDMVSVRVDGSWPNLSGYLVYTNQYLLNHQHATEVNGNLITVGGVWQVNPTVNLFAEYALEAWSGQTTSTAFPTLSNFLPGSQISVIELSWNLPRRVQLSLNYTYFSTDNDNPLLLPDGNTRGQFVTLNANYQFPRGQQIGLVVAPWSYHDHVTGTMSYDATVVMLTGSAKF